MVESVVLQDGCLILDWLSFTLPFEYGLASVEFLFGELEPRSIGIKGYSHSASFRGGGVVGWHPEHPEHGVHVEMSSSALSGAAEVDPALHDVRGFLIYLRDLGAKFSRVDYALDDREGLLDMETIDQHVAAKLLVTRWRKGNHRKGTLEGKGNTQYFGSMKSDSLLRIYDKRMEQMEKKNGDDPGHWVRVEMQFRRERAHAVVERYLEQGASAVIGLLRGLIEFKEASEDETKSRWPISPWWEAFLDGTEKQRLSLPEEPPTIERTMEWLFNQVAPSLAFVTKVEHGSVDFVYDLLSDGGKRLSPWQQAYLKLLEAAA